MAAGMRLSVMCRLYPGRADESARRRRRLPSTHRPRPRRTEERAPPIRLFLADVDGTLVTQDKVLTDAGRRRGAQPAPGRHPLRHDQRPPPRGMEMLIEPLDLDTPIAAFNGGLVVTAT